MRPITEVIFAAPREEFVLPSEDFHVSFCSIAILLLKEQNHYIPEIPATATLDSYPLILIPGFLLGALAGIYAAKLEGKEVKRFHKFAIFVRSLFAST